MLTSPPPYFPPESRTIAVGAVSQRPATGRPMLNMRQAMRSLFITIADFLRGKNASTAWASLSPAGCSSMGPTTVIGLVLGREDCLLLAGTCKRNCWRLFLADTYEEARTALDQLQAPVILCDRDLPGKGWREAVEGLATSPSPACVILVSAVVDTYLLDEVVRNGGYDVLSKPLREADVVRAIRLASLYWYSGARATSDLIQES